MCCGVATAARRPLGNATLTTIAFCTEQFRAYGAAWRNPALPRPRRQPPQAASLSYTLDCRGRTGLQRLSRTRSDWLFNASRFANSMSSSARDARLNPALAVCAQTISVRPLLPWLIGSYGHAPPALWPSACVVQRVSGARVEGGLASRPSCPRTPAPGPPHSPWRGARPARGIPPGHSTPGRAARRPSRARVSRPVIQRF